MIDHQFLKTFSIKFNISFDSIEQLFAHLLDPSAFKTVLESRSEPETMIALCLALKQNIKENNRKTYLLPVSPDDSQEQLGLVEHGVIMETNPLWQQLLQRDAIASHNSENRKVGIGSAFQPHLRLNQENFPPRDRWCRSLNYLYVLLQSLQSIQTMEDTARNQQPVRLASVNLRDQMIAKLISECLLNQNGRNIPIDVMLSLFTSEIEKVLPPDDDQVAYRLASIVQQLMHYLNDQFSFRSWARIPRPFRKDITKFAITMFSRFTKTRSKDIIAKLLDIILQLFKLPKFRSQVQEEQESTEMLQESPVVHRQILPAYLANKFYQLVNMMQFAVSILFEDEGGIQWQAIIKVISIMVRISQSLIFETDEPLSTNSKQVNQVNHRDQNTLSEIMNLFTVIAQRSAFKLTYLDRESSCYYQQCFIRKIMRSLCQKVSHSASAKEMLQYLLINYFPNILRVIRIRVATGRNNAISTMFYYLSKMTFILHHSHVSFYLNEITNILINFLIKCASEEFEEEFDSETFDQQNEAHQYYYHGAVILFLQVQKCSRMVSQVSHFTTLYGLLERQLAQGHKGHKRGSYLVRFVLQLVRRNYWNKQIKEDMNRMMVYLLKGLKDTAFQKQYLILLDIVSDKLIDPTADQFDSSLSELCYFLIKDYQTSLLQYTNLLAYQLINILVNQKGSYFVCYSVSVLCRTCKDLASVELNRKNRQAEHIKSSKFKLRQTRISKNQSLIKNYMFAVYHFFTNLESSTLRDLGHFQNRSDFFEMIALLGVAKIQDVYAIYDYSILNNMVDDSIQSKIYFLTDTTGLLRAGNDLYFKEVFLQLVFWTIQQNPEILAFFNVQTLSKNQSCFKVFYDFIMVIKDCNRDIFIPHTRIFFRLFASIKKTVNLLHTIYDTVNYQEITEIWLAYIKAGSPLADFPILPQKLYETQKDVARELLVLYCQNLSRVSSRQQMQIVYKNVFQRASFEWHSYQTLRMREQIIGCNGEPHILLEFADHIDISRSLPFFKYKQLARSIICNMYSQFVNRILQSQSSKQLDSFIDDQMIERPEPCITYINDFFLCRKEEIRDLTHACHIFCELLSGQQVQYFAYEKFFLQEMRWYIKQANP